MFKQKYNVSITNDIVYEYIGESRKSSIINKIIKYIDDSILVFIQFYQTLTLISVV